MGSELVKLPESELEKPQGLGLEKQPGQEWAKRRRYAQDFPHSRSGPATRKGEEELMTNTPACKRQTA